MKPITISVIIPVYQTEDYLSVCIESVLSQNYKYIEIILVDDGSKDRSPIICDDYAAQNSNIQVIHKKNEGPASARNAGMKLASGEYLMFLDSDDLLAAPDILQHMAAQVSTSDIDILVGNFCIYKKEQAKGISQHHLKDGSYTQTSEFRFHAFFRFGHLSYSWGKLYRKQFLEKNEIAFQDFPFAEDKLFNVECYLKGAIYKFTERVIVLYRLNSKSLTAQYYPEFITFWLALGKEYTKLTRLCHAPEECNDVIALHYLYGSFLLVKQEFASPKRNHAFRKSVEMLKAYVSHPPVLHMLHALSRGKYLRQLPSHRFRFALQGISGLLSLKRYNLFTLWAFLYYKLTSILS